MNCTMNVVPTQGHPSARTPVEYLHRANQSEDQHDDEVGHSSAGVDARNAARALPRPSRGFVQLGRIACRPATQDEV